MGYFSRISVELLGERHQAEILRFLYRNKPHRFSQRQIGDSLKMTPATVSRTCRRLEELHILERQTVGKSVLYGFEEDSFIARRILVPVFRNEERLFTELIDDIMSTLSGEVAEVIDEILLFGSVVNGEDTPESDIDLAIVIGNEGERTSLTDSTMQDLIREIEEHFIHRSVEYKIDMDVHIFFKEKASKKEKGIALEKVREKGMVVWRRRDEKSS